MKVAFSLLSDKTERDIEEEDYLTNKLIDIVNQRSKIVDSIDEDRLRLTHFFIEQRVFRFHFN